MARANAVVTGRVPVPPGAYVRTGPERPFDLPLRPYPPYVPAGYQNQYSANQPLVSVVASNLGGILGDLADAVAAPSWAAYAAFAGGLVAGGVGGFFAGRYARKRR